MLKGKIIHPEILAALGSAGHGSKILIADGNYPASTTLGPNAMLVNLNLAPGLINGTDTLAAIAAAVPIEAAAVMQTLKSGPYAMKDDPPIWNEFRQVLHDAGADIELDSIERHEFYETAGQTDVALTILTGEQRIYANLLLTIGVVMGPK